MFGVLVNPIKWIFRNGPLLSGFSFIMFVVSMILALRSNEIPFLLNISLFSFFNAWIFINEYRINQQLERLQIQMHKFNKIGGMIHITIFGLWEVMIIFFLRRGYETILTLPVLAIMILLSINYLQQDTIVRYEYNLGRGNYRKFINEDRLSAKPLQVSTYINFRSAWRNKGYAQIDWVLESGKMKTWHLNLENSDVILYLSNLMNQSKTTFVNGIPVFTQDVNTHVSKEIREIVATS